MEDLLLQSSEKSDGILDLNENEVQWYNIYN